MNLECDVGVLWELQLRLFPQTFPLRMPGVQIHHTFKTKRRWQSVGLWLLSRICFYLSENQEREAPVCTGSLVKCSRHLGLGKGLPASPSR